MAKKGYELEFDIWRYKGYRTLPCRVKVVGKTRADAEKRMRHIAYNYGRWQGRYVAFYPNGQVKDSKVLRPAVKNRDEFFALQERSAVVSREYHHDFGKRKY